MARNTRKKAVEAPKVDIGAEIFAARHELEKPWIYAARTRRIHHEEH